MIIQNNIVSANLVWIENNPVLKSLLIKNFRILANVFVRAKAKCPPASTCEEYVERANIVCTQSDYQCCRHDRTENDQNIMERSRTLDPTECDTLQNVIPYRISMVLITLKITLSVLVALSFSLTKFNYNVSLKLNNVFLKELNSTIFFIVLLLGLPLLNLFQSQHLQKKLSVG